MNPNFRPSKMDTLKHCPHFVNNEAGQAAIEGTRDHAALAANLRGAANWDEGIPADRVPEIEWFADFVKCNFNLKTLHVEEKITLFDPEMKAIMSGTPDVFDESPTLGDYKSGECHDYSVQMAIYSLAVMQLLDIPSIRVCIGYGKFRKVDDYRLTVGEALDIVRVALSAAERTDCKPTIGAYCSWCASALTCPARIGVVMDAMKAIFGDTLPAFDPQKLSDPQELSKALVAWKDYLEPWGKRLWDTAKMAAEIGAKIQHDNIRWELTSEQGDAVVTDMGRAFQLLALPQDKFLACCKLVQEKAAKALAEVHTLTRHAAAKEVKRRLEPVIIRGEPSVTLKRIEETKI